MIGSLRGSILEKNLLTDKPVGEILIEVSGVGYFVTAVANTVSQLEDNSLLYIHHHITESDQRLFGFLTKDERIAFMGLLSAHGVGPSLALAVLATHTVQSLANIIDSDDIDSLCEVPGVGKKTAQRLLVELKSSLVLPTIDITEIGSNQTDASNILSDVHQALQSLGYTNPEIRVALAEIKIDLDESVDSGELLKTALRNLSGT